MASPRAETDSLAAVAVRTIAVLLGLIVLVASVVLAATPVSASPYVYDGDRGGDWPFAGVAANDGAEQRVPDDVGLAADATGGYDDRSNLERASARPGGYRLAPQSLGALDDASRAAFRAADNVDDFAVPLKHQPWAGGGYNKFAEGVDQSSLLREALGSAVARFLPNNRPDSFRLVYDFGRPVGTRGETAVRIVVGNDGNIWTAFPVKP